MRIRQFVSSGETVAHMLQKGYVWSHVCREIRLFCAVVTSFINMFGFLILHISILPRIPIGSLQVFDLRKLWRTDYWGLEMFDPDTWTHKSFRPFTAPGTPGDSLGPPCEGMVGKWSDRWWLSRWGLYYHYTIPYRDPYSTQYNVYCILYYTIDIL